RSHDQLDWRDVDFRELENLLEPLPPPRLLERLLGACEDAAGTRVPAVFPTGRGRRDEVGKTPADGVPGGAHCNDQPEPDQARNQQAHDEQSDPGPPDPASDGWLIGCDYGLGARVRRSCASDPGDGHVHANWQARLDQRSILEEIL